MVSRLCIGFHPTYGYGAFQSIAGVDVYAATPAQMMWSTMQEQLQIIQSGVVLIDGGTSSPAFSYITWPDLGFHPLIFLSNDLYELRAIYQSTTQLAVRRNLDGEAGFVGGGVSGDSWVYYLVTRTPFQ